MTKRVILPQLVRFGTTLTLGSRARTRQLRRVQHCMFLVGRRVSVPVAARGQLDAAQVLHVAHLIQLARVARGRVADQEADRAAVLGPEARVAQAVDHNPLLAHLP